MAGYAKLFSTITESSLWDESKETRILFVTMLARADQNGFVEAALPGLARISNLSRQETENALSVLEAPDKDSKDPDHDGRRIAKVPGGWVILNYEKHRERRSEEDRRKYMRRYMAEYRRKHNVNNSKEKLDKLAKAETETEAEAVKKGMAPGIPSDTVTNHQDGIAGILTNEFKMRAHGCPMSRHKVKAFLSGKLQAGETVESIRAKFATITDPTTSVMELFQRREGPYRVSQAGPRAAPGKYDNLPVKA